MLNVAFNLKWLIGFRCLCSFLCTSLRLCFRCCCLGIAGVLLRLLFLPRGFGGCCWSTVTGVCFPQSVGLGGKLATTVALHDSSVPLHVSSVPSAFFLFAFTAWRYLYIRTLGGSLASPELFVASPLLHWLSSGGSSSSCDSKSIAVVCPSTGGASRTSGFICATGNGVSGSSSTSPTATWISFGSGTGGSGMLSDALLAGPPWKEEAVHIGAILRIEAPIDAPESSPVAAAGTALANLRKQRLR